MKIVLFILLILTGRGLAAQLIYETVWVDYDSAWEYKSMQLIPIRPKTLGGIPGRGVVSLSKAIQQGIAQISERGTASTENVHWLRVRNKSDQAIFVASGQIMTGGRQDRIVTRDTLLAPTGGDQYIPVMCIEEGRWSDKEKKILYGNYANLRLRKVLDHSKNQVLIWKEIFAQLDSADLNSPTLAYAAISQNRAFQLKEEEYFKFFQEKFRKADSTIVGFVCVTGNRAIGSDIFAAGNMFYDELEPLLHGYISEVMMNGSQPLMDKEDIKDYMDHILTDETVQEEYCKKNGKIFRSNGKVIHVTSY